MNKIDFNKLLAQIKADKKIVDQINSLGGLQEKYSQSDKIGYDFKELYLGDILLKKEYSPQEDKKGTQDNPLVFSKGIPLIPNVFYSYQNNKYIYIGTAKIADDWEQNLFVQF